TTHAPATTQSPATCSHVWVDDYIEHVSDRVPSYRTEYHDVCNQCGAILDGGLATDHLYNSEDCWSYTTNKPFDVLDGYWNVSYDWVKTQKCTVCGETKDVSGQYVRYNIIETYESL
ncbi:MAG: hypothetical protein Q4D76_20070, partial [Oscillospiraceae bacterium]|nr:hypothetical protein [Oscillospiraceae bacterium]